MATAVRWHGELAPGHERRDGTLYVGGVRVDELASVYGTPALILDGHVLDATISEFIEAAVRHNFDVAYAGKAFLLIELVRLLAQTPLQLDVCSLGELITAERGGMPAHRMTLHGCAKTEDELAAAAAGRVGRTVIDNLDELAALAAAGARIPLLLRINTGVEAHTHAFVQTAGDATKFGIAERDFATAAGILGSHPQLQFLGLHSHIGSQIYETGAFLANVHRLFGAAARFASWNLPVRELIVGGGFGVQTGPDADTQLDIAGLLNAIAQETGERARTLGIPLPRIGIEPGRAIIAPAGTSLYRVMTKKRQASRTFVVVDGGIADNPRPALYDAYHHAILASRTSDEEGERVIVCGRSCENDRLTEAILPRDVRAGDFLAVCTTGAYTYSMASNYNRFSKPAVVYAKDGSHRLLARRETIEDVVRNDVDV
ncbi:MAG: diaminopimelate decarboxylase [Candidatus Eremiobacteraeota bacterium]|nr:diaminopimelate decarboxylase [Candidatus Eremiobacteraeota bacterium]